MPNEENTNEDENVPTHWRVLNLLTENIARAKAARPMLHMILVASPTFEDNLMDALGKAGSDEMPCDCGHETCKGVTVADAANPRYADSGKLVRIGDCTVIVSHLLEGSQAHIVSEFVKLNDAEFRSLNKRHLAQEAFESNLLDALKGISPDVLQRLAGYANGQSDNEPMGVADKDQIDQLNALLNPL